MENCTLELEKNEKNEGCTEKSKLIKCECGRETYCRDDKIKNVFKKYGCRECWSGKNIEGVNVISYIGVRSKNHTYVVKCPCGTEIRKRERDILSGTAIECIKCKNGKNRTDYTGQIIEGFKIIGPTKSRTDTRLIIWKCKCIHCNGLTTLTSRQLSGLGLAHPPKCDCVRRYEFIKRKELSSKNGEKKQETKKERTDFV